MDQRHILPRDLPAAVKHLTDLDLLIVASLGEAKRRGRSLPSVQKEAAVPQRWAGRGKGRQTEAETVSLARGQINAVRAAFKAGITLHDSLDCPNQMCVRCSHLIPRPDRV